MASSFSFLTLFVLFCVYMPIGTMSFSMKLIPRVNFDSMLFPKNISLEGKHNRLVQLSKIHALKYQMNNTNAISPETFQPLVSTISGVYAVETLIGTPPSKTLLSLDTVLVIHGFNVRDARIVSHLKGKNSSITHPRLLRWCHVTIHFVIPKYVPTVNVSML